MRIKNITYDNQKYSHVNPIKYLLIFLCFFSMESCESKSDDAMLKIVVFTTIAVVGLIVSSNRNRKINQEDLSIIDKLKKKNIAPKELNQSPEIAVLTSQNENQFNEKRKSPKKEGEILIGIYSYKNNSARNVLLVGLSLLLLAFLFKDAGDEADMPIYFHGYIFIFFGLTLILTALIVFIIEKSRPYSTYIYHLYDDRIECFASINALTYTIYFSEILNVSIDYKKQQSRSGEHITRIFYNIYCKSNKEPYRIEVKNLKNKNTRKSFRDDLSDFLDL